MGIFTKVFGKKKMSMEEFAEGMLTLEDEWTKKWIIFFESNFGLLDTPGIKLESHILSLFIINLAIPHHHVKDIMFEMVAERLLNNERLMDYMASRFEEYNEVANNPLMLPQTIMTSISSHTEGDVFLDITSAPLLFFTFNNMLKATLNGISDTLDKYDVKGF